MEKFFIRPDITIYTGIRVTKGTKLEFLNEDKTVKQKLKDLVLTTELSNKGSDFETKSEVKNFLNEGDILIFNNIKGYQVPGLPLATAKEIKEDFENLM